MELDVTQTDFFAPHFTVDAERWFVWDAVWEQDEEDRLVQQLGFMYRHAETGLPLRVVWWRDEQVFELDHLPEPRKIRAMDASPDQAVPERLEWIEVPQEHAATNMNALLDQVDRDYCAAVRFLGPAPDAVECIEVEGEQQQQEEGATDGAQEQLVIELDGERIQFVYNLFMQALQQNYFVRERRLVRAKRGVNK